MILLAADGVSNRKIGELVDLHYNQVGLWRARYEELGLAGLEDEERPGRPCVCDHDDVLLLAKTVTFRFSFLSRVPELMGTPGISLPAA